MDIVENISDSFRYTKETLVGNWVRWITLLCITIIPIANFVMFGYLLRILRGNDPASELGEDNQLLMDGLLYAIIMFIWMIPVLIVAFIGIISSIGVAGFAIASNPNALGGAFLGMIVVFVITFIVMILCELFAIIGIIRFARTGTFGDAFAFGAIWEKIGEIGLVNYVISIIVLTVLVFIVYAILSFIPIIGWILTFVSLPFILILWARFINNLYDSAATD